MHSPFRSFAGFTLLLVTAFLISLAPHAFATNESAKQQFENCVNTEIVNERGKSLPSVSRVLTACGAEFSALNQAMPPGTSDQLKHLAEHYIETQLEK